MTISRPALFRTAVVGIALLAAACGGGSAPEEAGDGEIGSGVQLRETTTTAAGSPETTAAGPTQATAKAGSATTAKPGAAPKGTAAPLPTSPPKPGEDPIVRAAKGPPGGAAGIILQPTPAKAIVVEVLEEPNVKANQVALDETVKDLREVTGKNVSVVHNPLPPGSDSKQWNEAELAKLADAHSKVPQGGDRFVFKFLYVNGRNVRSERIYGTAFRGDLFVAYPDQYERTGTPQRVITGVTVHETGHLLGLVDNYLQTGRHDTTEDPAKGGHSKNKQSVMYYAVDPFLFGGIFGSGSTEFDAEDLRDMANIRKGAPPGSKG